MAITHAPAVPIVRKKMFVKIGRPGGLRKNSGGNADEAGYKIVKIREPLTGRMGLLFTVSLPEIKAGERPRRRFMGAYEQRREVPNRAFQYLVVSTIDPSNLHRYLGPADKIAAGCGAIRDHRIPDTV